jgi:hypothetical protein
MSFAIFVSEDGERPSACAEASTSPSRAAWRFERIGRGWEES